MTRTVAVAVAISSVKNAQRSAHLIGRDGTYRRNIRCAAFRDRWARDRLLSCAKAANPLKHKTAFTERILQARGFSVARAGNFIHSGDKSISAIILSPAGDPARLLSDVRRAMYLFAPDLPLLQPMTQQEQYERSYSDGRLVARLAVFFGLLAALLVATGLYGTLSYTVSRRTAEVGVRMALGARGGQVPWMVLRGSLLVSLAGVVLGLPLTIARRTSFVRCCLGCSREIRGSWPALWPA